MVLEALVIFRFLIQPLKEVLVERAAWRTPPERPRHKHVLQCTASVSSKFWIRFYCWVFKCRFIGSCRTGISSDVNGVVGLARVGACIRTLSLALLPVNHQLHPVAKFLGQDGVPLAVAEALPLGWVLCCDSSRSIVNMEEQLCKQNKNKQYILTNWMSYLFL